MKKLISAIVLLALCLTCFAGCSASEETTAAKDYLYSMYKDNAEATPSDYTVVGAVSIGGVPYSVTWSVDVTDGVKIVTADDGTVTVDVNEKTETEIPYVLTATVKPEKGASASVTFNRKVPAFSVSDWAQYVAAADDSTIAVQGVVTAIMAKSKGNSYNCLYLQDNDGGYYAYSMEADPVESGIAVGMTVMVTGTRATYSGTYEIMSAVAEIVDSAITAVTPADYTDLFTAAETLKDEALVAKQGMLVTVKGVEITGEDASSGYYKFKLGEKETYVRISSSVCPITKDEQATFKADHASHLGWTADVTGIICVYDGAFYLTPVTADAFTYNSLPVLDDAGMVEFEKNNLSFIATVSEDKEIELPTAGSSYTDVKISWKSDNANAVVSKDGKKLTVTLPDSDATVKLTATVKSGSAKATREFEFKLIAGEPTYAQIVAAGYALAEGESMDSVSRLYGVISTIDTEYSAEYGNITVTIIVEGLTEQPVQCFRMKGDGADKLAVGDAITVEGTIKNYKGTVEFDAGCAFIGKGEVVDQAKVVEAAYKLGEGETMNAESVLTGVISTIDTEYSAEYGNITVSIVVAGLTEKPITCFRMKGEGADKLAVGDTITVTGTIKNYKGTVEFDAGCTFTK